MPEGRGASLCVDLDYPKELHNLHNDYPLAPEKVLINGVEKLATNLGSKKEYYLTYKMLLFYLEKGLVLRKVHSGLSYRTEAFLKSYIDFCAEKRKQAKESGDTFGDQFFKLAANGVHRKTFESTRNWCNSKIMGGGEKERLRKHFSQPHFVSSHILLDSNIVMVRMRRIEVTLNKPMYLGAVILDKSKEVMYDFHYNYVMEKWGKERTSLLFTDTDSLMYCVETEDIYKDMIPDVEERFDTSKYPLDHPSGITPGS